MLGVPFDSGTSYRSGARLGPREIRAQSSLIRPYWYFQKISPFETLAIVDAGDVDAPPVGIEPAYAAIEAGVTRMLDAGAIAACRRRRPLDLAAVPARRVEEARSARAGPVRRAHRYVGRLLRRQVLSRIAVPPRDRGEGHRSRRLRPGRHPRADVRRGRGLRLPARQWRDDDRHRHGRSATAWTRRWRGCARSSAAARSTSRSTSIRSIPRSRPAPARRRSAGFTSYEAQELVRGLAGLNLVGCDVVEVAPPVRRPWTDHRAPRREYHVRTALRHRISTIVMSNIRCIDGGRTRTNTWNDHGGCSP